MNILLEQLEEAKRLQDEGMINLITQQLLYMKNPTAMKTESGIITIKPYDNGRKVPLPKPLEANERLGRREALLDAARKTFDIR